MRPKLLRVLATLFVAWTIGALASCDATENAIDCSDICDKYAECWDKDYDEEKCRSNCRSKANDDPDFESKVGQCAACVENKACVETFACGVPCSGIVP